MTINSISSLKSLSDLKYTSNNSIVSFLGLLKFHTNFNMLTFFFLRFPLAWEKPNRSQLRFKRKNYQAAIKTKYQLMFIIIKNLIKSSISINIYS